MMLGPTSGQVKRAHIWPDHTRGTGLELFRLQQADVNDHRNFLFLHYVIEHHFDRLDLTFVPFDFISATTMGDSNFTAANDSADSTCASLTVSTLAELETLNKFKLLVLNPMLRDVVVEPHSSSQTVKLGDLHGHPIRFGINMPFTRLLAAHAANSISHARREGWPMDPLLHELDISNLDFQWKMPLAPSSREGFDEYSAFRIQKWRDSVQGQSQNQQ